MTANTIRSQFTLPRDVCYLNAAYMTPQPKSAVEASIRGARQRGNAWHISAADFFTNVELLRQLFARLLGTSTDHIAIIPAASYGIACAAKNLSADPGQKILLLEEQFPSHYYAWERLANESGAKLCIVKEPSDLDWTAVVMKAIEQHGEALAIAALPNHHWSNGAPLDLELISKQFRQQGTKVVLDVTQTLGACPFDLDAIAPDYLISAGYKWLFCPYGVSFLYVAEEHWSGVPLEENWVSRLGSEDFSRLVDYVPHYQRGARRFDVGERASFANVSGAIAALELLLDWQVDDIASQLNTNNVAIAEIFQEFGFLVPQLNARAPHFQGMKIPAAFPANLVGELTKHGVFTSQRGDSMRVAPHLYNDAEDLQTLTNALSAIVSKS